MSLTVWKKENSIYFPIQDILMRAMEKIQGRLITTRVPTSGVIWHQYHLFWKHFLTCPHSRRPNVILFGSILIWMPLAKELDLNAWIFTCWNELRQIHPKTSQTRALLRISKRITANQHFNPPKLFMNPTVREHFAILTDSTSVRSLIHQLVNLRF